MGGYATKYNVSKSLLHNEELRRNVPETRMYSKSVLKTMLDKYNMVYVKPNSGTGGKGVMRVEKLDQGSYKYQLETSARTFNSFDALIQSISKKTKNCPYAVQRGIHLLRHSGRRFDLRIMVQKNPKGNWETTGVIGRLGHPKKIITNVCKGGNSKPVEFLLKKHVSNITEYTGKLRNLGYQAAIRLNKTFPKIKEIGLDVGIDRKLHPWILEANPQPAIYGFKTLKDKRIYQKMCRYQRAYGRR
ncbi:YheC/YheD family protein [Paenibacillaceae bacterium WGS1546]|uniref:YheC/YheD family protein n=1 Tax=Cohnella sp. WGS1546 TaxID=3366810 RepID=UPI00372CFB4E